jgi:NAD+ synthase (glutamine-hydrolysing)
MKTLIAQINPTVGDIPGNTRKIIDAIRRGKDQGADLVVVPEMATTGYPPEDLLLLDEFVAAAEAAIIEIRAETLGIAAIIGSVRRGMRAEKPLYNTAAVIENGRLIGYQDKSLLPTYDVFDERRYFAVAREQRQWQLAGQQIGITICEDMWQHAGFLTTAEYTSDPIEGLKGVDFMVCLSASPYHLGKPALRERICQKAAATLDCPVLFCNQIGGNDSLIFDGSSMAVFGKKLIRTSGFKEADLLVNHQTPAGIVVSTTPEEELYRALVLGVRDYFYKQGFTKACLGLSGGVDSALVACIACEALGKEHVLAVAMPSRYSSEGSKTDAAMLAANLGIELRSISIEDPFQSYLDLLAPQFEGCTVDATEENLQARIRGNILMALSNKFGHLLLTTGNKSEMAMGYATLYGDMAGGLGVINDVTKGQVYSICRWINRDQEIIPENTLTKPPSAELRPDQKDSDTLPDYAIIDQVLQSYVEEHRSPEAISAAYDIDPAIVMDLVRKIHRSEYKRRQAPPGLRVSEKAFSVGRRFPIVQTWV